MIVFEVFLNGRRVAYAGAKDLGVLSANVAGVGRLGAAAAGMPSDDQNFHLSVGGLTARKRAPDEHIDWLSVTKLKVGDEVQIRITEAKRADKPKSRRKANPKPRAPSEKKRFEFARAMYLKLRPKYECQGLTNRSSGRTKARAAKRYY